MTLKMNSWRIIALFFLSLVWMETAFPEVDRGTAIAISVFGSWVLYLISVAVDLFFNED